MKKIHLILGALALVIIAIAGCFFYYVNALKSVTIKDAQITSLRDITKEGFAIDGRITAYNPSMIDITVYESNVEFIKKNNDALLASGMINKTALKPKAETNLGFSGYVKFSNTLDLAADVVGKNETMIVARGNIIVSKKFGISVPFSAEFDINKQLRNYLDSALDKLLGFFGI